jgi:hypothetical protein
MPYWAANSQVKARIDFSMAKPHPWPHVTLDSAETIVSQNDLFVLSLVICHKHLKADNPGMLAGLLPSLMECVKIIHAAAVELGPVIENRPSDKLPLWAKQVNRIVDEYPAVLLRLHDIEPLLRQGRVIEIQRIVVELFNISAAIQVQFIKIALDKKRYTLSLTKIDQISEEIYNHK